MSKVLLTLGAKIQRNMIMNWFGEIHNIISFYRICFMLKSAKVIAVEMYYCCEEGLTKSVKNEGIKNPQNTTFNFAGEFFLEM